MGNIENMSIKEIMEQMLLINNLEISAAKECGYTLYRGTCSNLRDFYRELENELNYKLENMANANK